MPLSPRDPDYRPLLPLAPRFTPAGMELEVGTRTITVAGPPDQLARIAALCDGRHPAESIAATIDGVGPRDLGELLEALDDAGAVVDTSDAWRVFHRWTAVDSPLGRPVAQADLLAMLDERYEQPGIGAAAETLDPAPTSIDGLLARRRSSQVEDPPHDLTFGELSALLSAMYAGDGHTGRPVPSGGGLYSLALHVLLRQPVGHLAHGTWWYDPAAGSLRELGDTVPDVDRAFADEANTQTRLAGSQPVVILSADVGRGAGKYASRAYRLALIEVGAVMQNAYLAATDLGVPIRAMLGVDDRAVGELLKLPDGTVPLLALLIGQ